MGSATNYILAFGTATREWSEPPGFINRSKTRTQKINTTVQSVQIKIKL